MLITLLIIIAALVVGTMMFMKQEQFGALPTGERLEKIKKSPHYKEGKFVNLSPTPQLSEDTSMPKVLFRFLFGKSVNTQPKKSFQFVKTEIKDLDPSENVYIWFGHSSYYIQMDGKKILVDPVFSGSASPVSFTTKAFPGSDLYTPEDFPEIDYLVITHDHWDHLDYKTVTQLKGKVKNVITGLGTGAHLEHWGFKPQNITELDWFEKKDFGNGFIFNAESARHFSGRTFTRDQSLWMSFVLQTPTQTIYIGGDSGYDQHYKKIGEKFPSIDYAILENGQYNSDWKYIHMMPGEQNQAMKDLGAKNLIPVHNSKFKLAAHPWTEPLESVVQYKDGNYTLLTPKIGEKIILDAKPHSTTQWWKSLK